MKIYTYIRMNIDGDVLEEESFEYDGPVARCDGSDGDGGYGSIGGPPGVSNREASKDYWSNISGINSFDASADAKNLNATANAINTAATEQTVSSTYSASGAWDTFKDWAELVGRGLSVAGAAVSGDISGVISQGTGFVDHIADMRTKFDDTETAVRQALTDFGASPDDYSVSQIASAIDNEIANSENGGEWLNTLSSSRNADAPNMVSPGGTAGGDAAGSGGTTQTTFTSYQDALKYATGQAAIRADEAWNMYKEYVVPYEQEFYSQARTLIDPQMELSRQYLGSQIEQMPGYTEAAVKFREAAIDGVDPEQRADEAQADVEHAFKGSNETARRDASRMGLDLSDTAILDRIQTDNLDKARGTAGARTTARNNADTENFNRLGAAASIVPGSGQQGINFAAGNTSNPVGVATNQSGQAMSGASSGLNQETNAALNWAQLDQNKPYEPSFSDMLVNSALTGLSKTDWSKF